MDTKVAVEGNHSQHKRKRAEEAAPAEETAEEEMELEAEGGEDTEDDFQHVRFLLGVIIFRIRLT